VNEAKSLLLQLAIDAMTDRDALEVFADAVLEARWFDQRATRLIVPRELPLLIDGGWMRAYAENAKSDRNSPDWADWPRACAAVLLFGEWSRQRWPLIEANRVERWNAYHMGRSA
jgi:hypothetical protein